MKHYDYLKVKAFIDENKSNIEEASLGFNEDWFWTAETIFENGEYKKDLTQPDLLIGGIDGSMWATPTLEVYYLDGTSERIEVSKGKHTGSKEKRLQRKNEVMGGLGVLSKPLQNNRKDIDRRI